jgi:hypothetical protein
VQSVWRWAFSLLQNSNLLARHNVAEWFVDTNSTYVSKVKCYPDSSGNVKTFGTDCLIATVQESEGSMETTSNGLTTVASLTITCPTLCVHHIPTSDGAVFAGMSTFFLQLRDQELASGDWREGEVLFPL